MKKSTIALLVVLLIAGCVGAYWNAPKGQFVWDDINLIIYDYQIRDISFIKDVFSRDFFGFQDNARKYGYYRPIITLSYMLDYRIWGMNPVGFHITNVISHVLSTLFLFLLFLRLFPKKPLAPFLASMLFAVHPIHTECITWIAGRTDSVSAMFLFASIYFYMIWAERFASLRGIRAEDGHGIDMPVPTQKQIDGRKKYLFLSLFIYVWSILSKEMAIIMPAILLAYLVAFFTGFSFKKLAPFVWSLVAFVVIIAIYSIFRLYVIEFSTQAKDPWGVVTTLVSFVWTITYYLMKMAWPLHQTGYIQNELITSVLSTKVFVSFAVLGLLFWAVWASWSKDRGLWFSLVFLLLSFGPLSNFIRISGPKDMGFMTAERFLYIPSAAFFLIVGLLLSRLIKGVGAIRADREWGRSIHGYTAGAIAFMLVGVYTGLTIERNKIWYNNEVFFNDCLSKATNAPLLYMMLGNIYSLSGKYAEAEKTLKTAIEYLSPRDREEPTWIYSDLAGVYAKQGQYDKALEMMKLASRGFMHNSAVEFNMGEIYRMMGDLDKAVEYYKRSLSIDRKNIKALEQIGLVLQQQGDYEESNKWYVALSKLLPNYARVYYNIARNSMWLRDYPQAIANVEKSLRLNPSSAASYELLGNAYVSMNKADKGVEYLRQAVAMNPDEADLHAGLGNALFALGQKQEAHKELLFALKKEPNNIKALIGMGILASDQHHPEIAKKTFLRVLELEPDNFKAMLSLGILTFNQNEKNEAIEWFKKVLAEEPANKVAKSYLSKMGVTL